MSALPVIPVVGIDIGGANLKLARTDGTSHSSYFPLWSDHQQLAARLQRLLQQFCSPMSVNDCRLALTMTGEMADCFATRGSGVQAILSHVAAAAPGAQIFVYGVDGSWLSPATASDDPWRVASSNWHALASWLARAPGLGDAGTRLIVDIGSTTVDIIPVNMHSVATAARTDSQRLQQQQLVYTGLSRTPVAAILSQVTINGRNHPLVAEKFATSDDAYIVLGLVSAAQPSMPPFATVSTEDASNGQVKYTEQPDTADGRSRSVPHARARLARMLGEDSERLQHGEIEALAEQIVNAQAAQIAAAILHNLPNDSRTSPPGILFSGHGRCLAERALGLLSRPVQASFLEELISPAVARCGPAAAVAWLLEQRLGSIA